MSRFTFVPLTCRMGAGFEELQLMMEELLFEARKNLGKAGKDLEMMDISHTHLFTETHMFNR